MELFFGIGKFNSLKLEVFEKNIVALNFYKKNGFKIEGIIREKIYRNGVYENVVLMGMLKNEWELIK